KKIAVDIYDFDRSQLSREYVSSLSAGDYFTPDTKADLSGRPLWELARRTQSGDAEMALILPEDFAEQLDAGRQVRVGLVADGANANTARIGLGYAALMTARFNRRTTGVSPSIELHQRFLYNPESESVYFMVPGIVATLLTMVTVMLTAMAIVREREMGTLEQLMVTPMSTFALLLGKTTTFAILGVIEMIIALVVGTLWFGIPFVGSPPLLFALSGLYLLTTLGIGMFFSTVTTTQQQAMFMAWFFSVFSILTSGFFTPIANMPQWLQYVTLVNPLRYFLVIVRGIMMKGAGLFDLTTEIGALTLFGVVIFTFAVLRFHKRTA
ncbi:MAG: ABC transporter permease, partial [Candidatus Zixiibacteriota bacterium]